MSADSVRTPVQFRLLVLLVLIAGGLCVSFAIPDQAKIAEAAIKMELPGVIGEWWGTSVEPSTKEKENLADDTKFEKMTYTIPLPGKLDSALNPSHKISASIVMSGNDLNQSIHRIERCLAAQGYRNLRITPQVFETKGKKVTVNRVTCYHDIVLGSEQNPIQARINSVLYYFFVGNSLITSSHYERTFNDIRQRIVNGQDQRWGYVLISADETASLVSQLDPAGKVSLDGIYPRGRNEEQTDKDLRRVVQASLDECILHDQLK